MRFKDFERHARRLYQEIPEEYRSGVDGLTVRREALAHPTLPEVYTLGQCLTEEHPSDYGSSDTVRSIIALYWGSFRELAALDPDFDWEGETWETLTHELRHHLESLAGDDALEGVDYAADEMFKREEGLPFDPWYYQSGEDIGGGVYVVEGHHFLEQIWRAEDFEAATRVVFEWRGRSHWVPRPRQLGDVHFVWVTGTESGDPLQIVLVRQRGSWQALKRMVLGSTPVVLESEAQATTDPDPR